MIPLRLYHTILPGRTANPDTQGKIWVRQTERWGDLTVEGHEAILRLKTYPGGNWCHELYESISAWNGCLAPNFVQYRAALTAIARENWSHTNMPVMAHIDGPFPPDLPPASYLVPTDDDDWFDPSIEGHLRSAFEDENVRLVYWDCHNYFVRDGSIKPSKWPELYFYGSNGYAVRSHVDFNVINDHAYAREVYPINHPNVCYIDKPLSIWVKHSASTGDLDKYRLDPDGDFRIPHVDVPRGLRWAEPYVQRLGEIEIHRVRYLL